MTSAGCQEVCAPCPDCIAVIGGGRWARVFVEVLCGLVAPSIEISVHSAHGAAFISSWAEKLGLGGRIKIYSEWPQFDPAKSTAVVVVNAARDHERAVAWALTSGVPVLVEKPVALDGAAAQRLADLALRGDVSFAAAHIFLFARYLENFSRLVRDAGGAQSISVQWMDPRSEDRYGEQKHFDAGLPVFSDWLPHVLSIIATLAPGLPMRCGKVDFSRGGASLELEIFLGDVPCNIQLVRNGESRQRSIDVVAGSRALRLDFSQEPGVITDGCTTMVGDDDWGTGKRPSARMLTAFLQWAAGGECDGRLSADIGVRTCHLIDQVSVKYRCAQLPWLAGRLVSPGPVDDDLRYALGEMLQREGPLQQDLLERRIERVIAHFSLPDHARSLASAGWRDLHTLLQTATLG